MDINEYAGAQITLGINNFTFNCNSPALQCFIHFKYT